MSKPFTAKMNFDGHVALVTGGASGIGFAIARQLAGYITGHILGIDGGFLAAGIMHKN